MVSAVRTRMAVACASICGVRVYRRPACAAVASQSTALAPARGTSATSSRRSGGSVMTCRCRSIATATAGPSSPSTGRATGLGISTTPQPVWQRASCGVCPETSGRAGSVLDVSGIRVTRNLEVAMRLKTTRTRLCVALIAAAVVLAATPTSAQQWPAETVHRVQPEVDGGYPTSLIRASDGNLYGVAPDTYTDHGGSVFRMRPDGLFTVLYRFTGGLDGDSPASGLIQAADGNLYGMAVDGGRYGFGTVFRMTLDGQFTSCIRSRATDGAYHLEN